VGVWLIGSAIARRSLALKCRPHIVFLHPWRLPGWCSAASALQVALPVDMTQDEPGLTRSP